MPDLKPADSPSPGAREPGGPRPASPTPPLGPITFNCCPICGQGPVRKKGSAEDDELYACDTCDSDLRENIFGFRYVRIDQRFEKRKAEFTPQTFTKQELTSICEQLKRPEPAETKGPVRAQAGEASGPPAETSAGEPEEQQLWWTLDEEEVARRKSAASGKKDVTVDDLLHEVKQKQADKRPTEKK